MDSNNLLFKASKVKKTVLDKEYNRHINNIISTLDEENESRWETYNLIIDSLTHNDYNEYINEVKYRLTDGENPNEIMLDIIERNSLDLDDLIWLLRKRIEEYIEEDFIKKFYI